MAFATLSRSLTLALSPVLTLVHIIPVGADAAAAAEQHSGAEQSDAQSKWMSEQFQPPLLIISSSAGCRVFLPVCVRACVSECVSPGMRARARACACGLCRVSGRSSDGTAAAGAACERRKLSRQLLSCSFQPPPSLCSFRARLLSLSLPAAGGGFFLSLLPSLSFFFPLRINFQLALVAGGQRSRRGRPMSSRLEVSLGQWRESPLPSGGGTRPRGRGGHRGLSERTKNQE